MQALTTSTATSPRPSRLNAAGRCVMCLTAQCESARCIAWFAHSVWEICERCGGTEYVGGHIDPETSSERCDCINGLTEAAFSRPLAEVVSLRPEPAVNAPAASVVYECWPADGGAPVRWTGR